ncbi:type 1 fimbrial protein [Cronobacter dublinensis]|nr:type 1 fimbrial protein [Cronobacter dublinensis]ELY3970834.1 type 1 fimbrial protein [Cronobacter dublinensis]ELY4483943.1 type 1 fimbrial protein [Cronobacter dublinensis]ELY5823924.1 type 1 fimbrial protein [Cronobacter dublinensis]
MHKSLSVTLIATALVVFSASAQAQTGGTIAFHGAIVEEVCSVAHNAARIELTCPRGHQVHRQTLSLRSSGVRETHSPWVHSRLDYLNPEQTLGILTLTYR